MLSSLPPMPSVQQIALSGLAELDQLEEPFTACMESGDPEAVAVVTSLLGLHMLNKCRDFEQAMSLTNTWRTAA